MWSTMTLLYVGNLRINIDAAYCLSKIGFMGYFLREHDIGVDSSKVEAIHKARIPISAAVVWSF